MQSRSVVGKRIVRVNQTRSLTNTGVAYDVHSILLENGTLIRFRVLETENDDYVIDGRVSKVE